MSAVPPPAEDRRNAPHYAWLDCLRFGAALLVVLQHARSYVFASYGDLDGGMRNGLTAAFYAATRLGAEAVIVFFVLSGYLVGGRAFRRIYEGRFDATDYAIDRVTRIWVPLVPALVLSALLHPGGDSVGTWLANLAGLQGVLAPMLGGNGPLWSLAYEIWFYVLVFAVARAVAARGLDTGALLLLLATAVVFSALHVEFLACWLIGALAYLRPHALGARAGVALGAGLAAAAVAGLVLTGDGVMGAVRGPRVLTILLTLLLAVGAAIACGSLVRCRPSRLSAWGAPLAAFSYTLYLTHYPILSILPRIGWAPSTRIDATALGVYALAIAACLLVAWVAYLAFERHTATLRGWLKSPKARAASA